jgi:hypothetical protein
MQMARQMLINMLYHLHDFPFLEHGQLEDAKKPWY